MAASTYLRLLRLKYDISLCELADRADVSAQHISRLELCQSAPTKRQETQISNALAELIADRQSGLAALERDYLLCKGRLLEETEDLPHGI